jgi:hypothetical protein
LVKISSKAAVMRDRTNRQHPNRSFALLVLRLLWSLPAAVMAAQAADAGQHDPVKLQLRGPHQFRFAGYYAAKEKGFYREGLEVELHSEFNATASKYLPLPPSFTGNHHR